MPMHHSAAATTDATTTAAASGAAGPGFDPARFTTADWVMLGVLALCTVRLVWALWRNRRGVFVEGRHTPPAEWTPPGFGAGDALLSLLGGVLLVYMSFGILAGLVLAIMGRPTTGGEPGTSAAFASTAVTAVLAAVQVLTWCLGTVLLARLMSPAGVAAAGLSFARPGRAVLAGCDAVVAVLPLVVGLNLLSQLFVPEREHQVLVHLRESADTLRTLVLVGSAVVAAPLAEEFVFRGMLQGLLRAAAARLLARGKSAGTPGPDRPPVDATPAAEPAGESAKSRPSSAVPVPVPDPVPPAARWIAIGLTSVMFGAVHYPQPQAVVPLAALSVAMGLVYERTGTILAPVAAHALFNLINVGVTVLLLQ